MLILTISCSYENKNFLTSEEQAWLDSLEEGQISVLFGYEAPPDAFTNEMGVYTGLLVDFYREVEKILNVRFPMKTFATWAELMDYAAVSENYFIIGLIQTEERDQYMNFTSPFFSHEYALITGEGREIKTLSDIAGMKICAIEGYAIFDTIENYLPGMKLYEVQSDLEGLQKVISGEFDGMINITYYSEYHISNQRLSGLTVHKNLIKEDLKFRISTSKDDIILAGILDKAVGQIPSDRLNDLTDYWRSREMKQVNPRVWRGLYISVGIMLIIIMLILTWILLLKMEVRRKTAIILNSEKERNEEARSESLKILAGGISHDFNNILSGISGFMDLALYHAESPYKTREYFEKIKTAISESRHLNNQLMIFARGGDPERTQFAPSGYFREMIEFSLHGRHPELITDIPDDLYELYADKGGIGQVISNLIINAIQAMPAHGKLQIKAWNAEKDGSKAVRLSIRDNGPGIPQEIQDRIFDPYFTTKEDGNGLGLASCSSIINAHGGSIVLHSEPGKGSEFIIILPAHEA